MDKANIKISTMDIAEAIKLKNILELELKRKSRVRITRS